MNERERNGLFNDTLNTFYLWLYGVRHMVVRKILIVRKETCCHHIGYSYRLAARVLLYAPSHRQNNTVVEHWLEREIAQWVSKKQMSKN